MGATSAFRSKLAGMIFLDSKCFDASWRKQKPWSRFRCDFSKAPPLNAWRVYAAHSNRVGVLGLEAVIAAFARFAPILSVPLSTHSQRSARAE